MQALAFLTCSGGTSTREMATVNSSSIVVAKAIPIALKQRQSVDKPVMLVPQSVRTLHDVLGPVHT